MPLSPNSATRPLGVAKLTCNANELEHTVVTPHLDCSLESGTNVLWCATAQIAWNELSSLVGEEIHMESEAPMVAILNKEDVTRADLDEQTYLAAAGIVREGIVQDLHAKVNERFADGFGAQLLPESGTLPPDWFVAYSCMVASLPFEWAFERLTFPLAFRDTDVESFGIAQFLENQDRERKAATQIDIFDYRDEDDFIVELKTLRATHRLFLAKVQPKPTLEATISAVQQRVAAAQPTTLSEGSDFRVPVLNFDTVREYVELQRKPLRLKNTRFDGCAIAAASQRIRFRLDERGAVLRSESTIVASAAEHLVFDKPFLIMIQYDAGTMPYFALWVDNAELLVPFDD